MWCWVWCVSSVGGGCRVASVSVDWAYGRWLLGDELTRVGGDGGETRGVGDG